MDVILDSNIIRRDLKLTDKNFEILRDYLAKTDSKIIVPSIVLEEVKGLFKRLLIECSEEYEKSLNKLNRTLISFELPKFQPIEIEVESQKYIDYLKEKLQISSNNIIHYKNEYLPELVSRAIERKKPLDNKGQQFRDGLLWLTVLDYAETAFDKSVVFISDNPSDFSDKGNNNNLSTELSNEAEDRKLNIKYFRNLEDFVRQHASDIEFITSDWIKENIDLQVIEELFDSIIENSLEDELIESYEFERNEKPTGYINRTDYFNEQIWDFYVYQKSDGTILLNLDLRVEFEFEIEIRKEIEKDGSSFGFVHSYNPRTNELDWDMEFVPSIKNEYKIETETFCPLLIGKYVITISDKKIVDYEFRDWDWG